MFYYYPKITLQSSGSKSKSKSEPHIPIPILFDFDNDFDFEKISKARLREEMSNGRRFRNIREQVAWPRRRVLDHLRGKEGRLSIIEDDDLIPEDAEWDYLYRIESGTNVQQFPELEKPDN